MGSVNPSHRVHTQELSLHTDALCPPLPMVITWWLSSLAVSKLHSDAEVVVKGEFVAVEHVWPGKAIGLHDGRTRVAHNLTK